VVAGRNKPARWGEEETVERVRNPEDGTKRAWEARDCGLATLMPQRGREPQGRGSARAERGGYEPENSEGEAKLTGG
jgi:hypothetical protein